MKLLIAEDDSMMQKLLDAAVKSEGFDTILCSNGAQALAELSKEDSPDLVLCDWLMPEINGIDVIKRLRENDKTKNKYVIMLTSRSDKEDIVSGLDAGADDYLIKPFNKAELGARIRVGVRVLNLQKSLAERVIELEKALAEIKQLKGLIPICSYCKKIRNDDNYWEKIEKYLAERSDVQFSHGICPDCMKKLEKEMGLEPEEQT